LLRSLARGAARPAGGACWPPRGHHAVHAVRAATGAQPGCGGARAGSDAATADVRREEEDEEEEVDEEAEATDEDDG
jgi:ribosomal protein L12E/L44/L45/RPP1/RPP2